MGKTAFLYTDEIILLADAAVDLVDNGVTCVDPNYPIGNLKNAQIALRTWTDTVTDVKLQFDLGSTKQLQAFFIGNHNFTSGTFNINSYTDAAYSANIEQVEVNKAIRLLDVYHYESSTPTTRQYWEFDFTNTVTTDPDAVFKIGRVMVDDGSVPTQITSIPDYITPRGLGFGNIVNITEYRIRWVHKKTGKRERFELGWNQRPISDSIHTELRALYEAVSGDADPLVFIPDIGHTPCYYVYIEDPELLYAEIFNIQTTGSHVGNFRLRLVEAVRGKA